MLTKLLMKLFFTNRIASLLLTALLTVAGLTGARAQTALWSTTPTGGSSGVGVIYSIDPDGSNMQLRYEFLADGIDGNNPYSGLTQAGGLLYGLTSAGGTSGSGTLFSIDPVSGNYQKLADFTGDNGAVPTGGLTVYNGVLYGLANGGGANGMGVIFSYDPVAGVLSDVCDLSYTTGGGPSNNITVLSNQFFFTTTQGGRNGGGTLAVYTPATNTCTDLYDLSNGIYTACDLVFYNNLLYGFNANGGQNSGGQIFSFDPVIRKYTVLYTFPSQFSSDAALGYSPANMILYKNKFYGTTYSGGNSPSGNGASGVLFSFDPATKAYADIFDFDNSYDVSNGGSPGGKPLILGGKLFGTATYGGPASNGPYSGNGNIYQFNLSSNTFTKLADFDGTDGMNPNTAQLLPVGPVKVGAAAQTIASFADSTKTYGAPDFYLGATTSSGLPITYSTSDYTVGALIGNGLHIAGAGTCIITASQPGDSTYAAATPVSITLTVNKAPLLIKADDQIAYQDQPVPSLTVHYSGFVNGEDSSFLSALPVVSSVVDATTPQGRYPITVSGAASNNYDISYQDGTFYVYGLQQSFTVTDTAATYGDADFAVATASSGLAVTYSVADPTIAEASATPGLLRIKGAGTTRVAVIQAGNSTYAPGSDSVTITINKAPLTITANNQTIVYGQPEPVFTVTYSGFVNGENSTALTTIPLVLPSATSEPIYPGNYLVEVSGALSRNYAFTYINGVFTVTLPGDSLNAFVNAPGSMAVNILSTATQKAQLALYSLAGQRVLTAELSLQNGFNQFTFPTDGLSAGIYVVRIEGSGLHLNQKLRIK